jgi:hypothetical protein
LPIIPGSGQWLGASQQSEGKAFHDAAAWRLAARLPDDVANRTLKRQFPAALPS